MTPETKLAKEIQLWCGQNNYLIIRLQSGLYYDQTGSLIRIGFPGLSDYLIISPSGIFAFAELKVKPNRPSKEQLNFIDRMKERNVRAGVCYSVNDVISLFNS